LGDFLPAKLYNPIKITQNFSFRYSELSRAPSIRSLLLEFEKPSREFHQPYVK